MIVNKKKKEKILSDCVQHFFCLESFIFAGFSGGGHLAVQNYAFDLKLCICHSKRTMESKRTSAAVVWLLNQLKQIIKQEENEELKKEIQKSINHS